MTETNNLPFEPLSAEEISRFRYSLMSLLAKQTERYTMGESSSVRVDTARELLRSVCYCLSTSADTPEMRWRELLSLDIDEEFKAGQRRIEREIERGKHLWYKVSTNMPPVENLSMADTLRSLGGFWRKYNYRFFAHECDCDIDYQLAVPVPEDRLGIDYVNLYLTRLWTENSFILHYDPGELTRVLELYCPDYRGLLINLFEPVFTNALGLVLLGREGRTLRLCSEEIERLADMFDNLPRAGIVRCLSDASASLLCSLHIESAETGEYTRLYCGELAARIEAVRDCGGLDGIFLAG